MALFYSYVGLRRSYVDLKFNNNMMKISILEVFLNKQMQFLCGFRAFLCGFES
jgi:hypothetical protein